MKYPGAPWRLLALVPYSVYSPFFSNPTSRIQGGLVMSSSAKSINASKLTRNTAAEWHVITLWRAMTDWRISIHLPVIPWDIERITRKINCTKPPILRKLHSDQKWVLPDIFAHPNWFVSHDDLVLLTPVQIDFHSIVQHINVFQTR